MKQKAQQEEPISGPVLNTWEDLKKFANTLTKDQLEQPIRYWGEGHAGVIASANVLKEPFVHIDEFAEPISKYKNDKDWHTLELEAEICYRAGTILLATDELAMPFKSVKKEEEK
jgi:hypothetical protein